MIFHRERSRGEPGDWSKRRRTPRAREGGRSDRPILAVYVWIYRRQDRTAWLLTLVPPATILIFELCERWSSGELPVAVAVGYMSSYGFAGAHQTNCAVRRRLSVHACFMIFPALLPGAALLELEAARPRHRFPGGVDRAVLRRRGRLCSSRDRRATCCPWPRPLALAGLAACGRAGWRPASRRK
jgi:hypothetical protein